MASCEFEPPTAAYAPDAVFPPWRDVFPFLAALRGAWRDIRDEVEDLSARGGFVDWPETALYRPEAGDSWRVLPVLYTLPADVGETTWVARSFVEAHMPRTAAQLAALPGLRTALFSRLGPGTVLTPHSGWAALSNHVLRCHLALSVPPSPSGAPMSGVTVGSALCAHEEGEILVFDDSHIHSAFNNDASASRLVLIIDIVRPAEARRGIAVGGTTAELEAFVDYFK